MSFGRTFPFDVGIDSDYLLETEESITVPQSLLKCEFCSLLSTHQMEMLKDETTDERWRNCSRNFICTEMSFLFNLTTVKML